MAARNETNEAPAGLVVIGLFPDPDAAALAIRQLKDAGFTEEEIGVIVPRRAYERMRLEERRRSLQRMAAKARDGIETLLVPTDGSGLAQRALPTAGRLAQRLGANIRLYTAHGKDPVTDILEEQERVGAEAICMATHGHGRSAALIGSVASEVVSRSGEPVILVGMEADETAPWLRHDLTRSGVVACVDESEESAALLPVLMQWSRLLRESQNFRSWRWRLLPTPYLPSTPYV